MVEYSRRSLTCAADKLPALSRARVPLCQAPRRRLPRRPLAPLAAAAPAVACLCGADGQSPVLPSRGRRRRPVHPLVVVASGARAHRAASWVACSGAEIVGREITPAVPIAPFGSVAAGGYTEVRGQLKEVAPDLASRSLGAKPEQRVWFRPRTDEIILDAPSGERMEGTVWCLTLAMYEGLDANEKSMPYKAAQGLVLRRREDGYVRIGWFAGNTDAEGWVGGGKGGDG